MNKRKHFLITIWYLSIFAFFCFWFTQILPLVVYDTDDWNYIGYVRSAHPIWGDWNPAKVFPEIIMPFFSSLGRYLLYPLSGDYIGALTITHAAVVSGFLTLYVWCLAGMLKRLFRISRLHTGLTVVFFLLLHFLFLRISDTDNSYLFNTGDLNCYYNYLIPGLLNASIVMLLIGNPVMDAFLRSGNWVLRGFFLLLLYLAIFSNLACSGILTAYAGSCILVSLWTHRKRFSPVLIIKENSWHLGILLAWFISAVYEMNGGRAQAAGNGGLLHNALDTFTAYSYVLTTSNRYFWYCVLGLCLAAGIVFFFSRKHGTGEASVRQWVPIWFFAVAALHVYTILLCASVWPEYIYRSEYLFAPLFYIILIAALALGYLFYKFPQLALAVPLVLLILISEVNTPGKTFREPNMSNYDGSVCADISRDILQQVLEADRQGLTELDLYIPKHVADLEQSDNWPHSLGQLQYISKSLYEQGMIHYPIILRGIPSEEFNERHHLPIPQ